MSNENSYGSTAFRLPKSLALRSEFHALRLANAQDLWYAIAGIYPGGTNSQFGYVEMNCHF